MTIINLVLGVILILLGVYLAAVWMPGYALFAGVVGAFNVAIWKTHK